MYSGQQGLYQSGQRFSLAGVSNENCADSAYAADYPDQCGGNGAGGAFNWNDFAQTVLNDVTQIAKPGTPQFRPLYTPASTTLGSAFSSPALLIGGAVVAYLVLSRRR